VQQNARLPLGNGGRELNQSQDEKRWRLALDSGWFGVWDLNPRLEEVHYSPLWKVRMGYPDEYAADSTSFWRCRVHPDDLGSMVKALRTHFDGFSTTYEMRFRLRSNGSGYRDVLSRGRVVERDPDGSVARVFGTMVDLTARPPRPLRAGLASGARVSQAPGRDLPLHHKLGLASPLPGPELRHAAIRDNAASTEERARLLARVHDLLDLAVRDSSVESAPTLRPHPAPAVVPGWR
jgi:hypothetical protein